MNKHIIQIEFGKLTNSCFVVMPFSQLFQTEYEKIIQPARQAIGITCIRRDEIYTKQRIMDDIWSSIRNCRFVLAELTGRNPNVMYEIGLAHAIGKPVIIITRNADDVPFDLKDLRYLYYDVNDPYWGDNLKTGIQNLVTKLVENPDLEIYLSGISRIDKIEFPELSEIKPPPKSKIVDISGIWKGEFGHTESPEEYKILLNITQTGNELNAISSITYESEGEMTVVQQVMDGSIKKNIAHLNGVNYTFIHRGKSTDYFLDAFQFKLGNKVAMVGKFYDVDDPKVVGKISVKKESK